MKPAKEWAEEFCNKIVINAPRNEPDYFERFIERVQQDAIKFHNHENMEAETNQLPNVEAKEA